MRGSDYPQPCIGYVPFQAVGLWAWERPQSWCPALVPGPVCKVGAQTHVSLQCSQRENPLEISAVAAIVVSVILRL